MIINRGTNRPLLFYIILVVRFLRIIIACVIGVVISIIRIFNIILSEEIRIVIKRNHILDFLLTCSSLGFLFLMALF